MQPPPPPLPHHYHYVNHHYSHNHNHNHNEHSYHNMCHLAAMGVRLRHISALMWKNYRIHRKRPILTCFTSILPSVFSLILVMLQQKSTLFITRQPDTWIADTPSLCFTHEHGMSSYCYLTKKKLSVYYTPHINATELIMSSINEGIQKKIGKFAT